MIRVTRLLLQVEDESADLLRADRGRVRAGAVGQQEFAEIADALGDDLDGSKAFAFGSGAQLVAL